jgi:hypothetical protein
METVMRTKPRKILAVAVAAVVAAVAVGGVVKWSMVATKAAPAEKASVGISPFDIMLKSDMKKLPLEEFRDGECPARC